MAASTETLRFDIVGADKGASEAFSRVGRSVSDMGGKMDAAAAKAGFLDEALKRQASAARASADATLALAKSDAVLAEVEGRLRDGALEAEFALKKEAEAKKRDAEASRKAAEANKRLSDSLDKLKERGGPGFLGPALALAPAAGVLGGIALGAGGALAGLFAAGATAAAAFGAVAKPVLSQALTAEQAAGKAQSAYNAAIESGTKHAAAYKTEQAAIAKAYAGMSPQQIALSKQLGDMSSGWAKLKQAETPLVAGALAPWLKSVTDLTGKLPPVITAVSRPVADLGRDFDSLVNSKTFTTFRDFIANTGSVAIQSGGYTLIDVMKSLITLAPQFTPLIDKASRGIAELGPAILKWSQSKKASDDITKFMDWFTRNGPVVGDLLKNVGGALKNLAPGLGSTATSELSVLSGFFGFIAKLPPAFGRPLAEVAGVLLTLNKLGLVKVGIKLLGFGGAGAVAGEAAGAAGAAGVWGKLLPGVAFVGGALVATIAVHALLSWADPHKPGESGWNNPFGADPTSKDPAKQGVSTWAGLGHIIEHVFDGIRHDVAHIWDVTWNNTIGRAQRGVRDVSVYVGSMRHGTAHDFDTIRHDVAHTWDTTWNNTAGRAARGAADVNRLLGGWEHNVAHWFDTARHDTASTWDTIWNNTAGRAARGVGETVKWIGTLPGRIGDLFSSAGTWLVSAGASMVSGLVSGIESAGGAVASALEGLIPSPVRGVISKVLGWAGFAGGTNWAPAGWAWVGERGPELMRFRGGEQVIPAHTSAAIAAGGGAGTVVNNYITVNVPPTAHPLATAQAIAELLKLHTGKGGRLYPAGVTPK